MKMEREGARGDRRGAAGDAMLCALVAAPGFLSDRDSTAPLHPRQEARQ